MQSYNNPIDFYNRKDFYSVILQGVCDSKKKKKIYRRAHSARSAYRYARKMSDIFRNSPRFQNIILPQLNFEYKSFNRFYLFIK